MWQHSADDVDYEAWAWDQPDGTILLTTAPAYGPGEWLSVGSIVSCDDPEEQPGSPICK